VIFIDLDPEDGMTGRTKITVTKVYPDGAFDYTGEAASGSMARAPLYNAAGELLTAQVAMNKQRRAAAKEAREAMDEAGELEDLKKVIRRMNRLLEILQSDGTTALKTIAAAVARE
jgi:hypothetical protein